MSLTISILIYLDVLALPIVLTSSFLFILLLANILRSLVLNLHKSSNLYNEFLFIMLLINLTLDTEILYFLIIHYHNH